MQVPWLGRNNPYIGSLEARFRHPTRNECMGWFAQIQVPSSHNKHVAEMHDMGWMKTIMEKGVVGRRPS